MEYSVEYEYYLKHKKLWYKIAELFENKDRRIYVKDLYHGYPRGSILRIKYCAFEDLGYNMDNVLCGCFACEALKSNGKFSKNTCKGSCILLWDETYMQIPFSCERKRLNSPYYLLFSQLIFWRPDESSSCWSYFSNLALEVAAIPFNEKEYSKYKE